MKRIVRLIVWALIMAPFVVAICCDNALALFGGVMYFATLMNCNFFTTLSKLCLKDMEYWESKL